MAAITRREAVRLIEKQFEGETGAHRKKCAKHYYGVQELRELLDAIYGGPPVVPGEHLAGHPMNGNR